MSFELYEVLMDNDTDKVVGFFFDELLAKNFIDFFKNEYGCKLKIETVNLNSKELHILTDLLE